MLLNRNYSEKGNKTFTPFYVHVQCTCQSREYTKRALPVTDVKPYFSHGGSTVHRFPGFAQGYAGGKRVEIKSTPSRVCRQFMMRNFDEVCKLVLKNKNSRNPLIQQTLLTLLPRIAALNQELFALK